MNRRTVLLIMTLSISAVTYAESPEKVTIGDVTIECRTVEEIRKLGFECEDVPWQENAARVYIEAMNLCEEPSEALDAALLEGTKTFRFDGHEKEVEKHFNRNQQGFDLVVQADGMRFAAPMGRASSLIMTMIPELTAYVKLTRETMHRAAWDFSQGRQREAAEKCLLVVRIGRRVGKGHSLLAYLVGVGSQALSLKALDRMLASGKMDDGLLKAVAEELAKARSIPDTYEHAMRCERLVDLDVVRVVAEGKPEDAADMLEMLNLPADTKFDFDASRNALETVHDFFTKWNVQPPPEAFKPENHPDVFVKHNPVGNDPFVRVLIPAVSKVRVTSIRMGIHFDAIALHIALERFRLAKKSYPKTLAELVGPYLDDVPIDPFSGKPFRYRLEDDGAFTLWSIGEDLTDDGGKGERLWDGPDYVFPSRRQDLE